MRVLLVLILIGIAYSSLAWGTLPPPTPAAKQKAVETAATSAWSDKTAQFQTCRAVEHVVDVYRRELRAEGKDAPSPQSSAPCQDPGPYVAPDDSAKPLEASGAHSPPKTATSPPGSRTHAADLLPAPKP